MRNAIAILLLIAALTMAGARADAASLYWLDTNYGAPTLNRSDSDGLGATSAMLVPGTLPEGLAVDGGGLLYWAEASWSGARVMRATSVLTGVAPLVNGGSVQRGIAVDDVAHLLYWTSSNLVTGAFVHRATVFGAGVVPLITLAAGANPRGIAVDHAGGKIYWADFGQDAMYRANLDGSAPAVWITLPAGCGPYGVAFDPTAQLVYWTEYNTGFLRRAATSGASPVIIASGLANPTYLALDPPGNRIYWAEGAAGAQRLRRSNISGGGVVTLPPPLTTYGGLAFGSDAATPVAESALPTEFAIDRVWPSPGRGMVRVAFSLPRETRARLSVIDLQGREVAVLASGVIPAGRHERSWNGRAGAGSAPPGVYFVRMTAEGRSWVRRLVIVG